MEASPFHASKVFDKLTFVLLEGHTRDERVLATATMPLGLGLLTPLALPRGDGSPTFLPRRDSNGLRFERAVEAMAAGAFGSGWRRCFISSRFGNVPDGGPGCGGSGVTFRALPFDS